MKSGYEIKSEIQQKYSTHIDKLTNNKNEKFHEWPKACFLRFSENDPKRYISMTFW